RVDESSELPIIAPSFEPAIDPPPQPPPPPSFLLQPSLPPPFLPQSSYSAAVSFFPNLLSIGRSRVVPLAAAVPVLLLLSAAVPVLLLLSAAVLVLLLLSAAARFSPPPSPFSPPFLISLFVGRRRRTPLAFSAAAILRTLLAST
ncbi:unnamed protein product, partial [Urochloa humidicola]